MASDEKLVLTHKVVATQTQKIDRTGTYENIIHGKHFTNYKLGAGDSGVCGTIDLRDTGAAHGECYGVYAEMIPPNSSLRRGALYSLGVGIGAGASSSWGSAGPVAFVKFDSWGTATNVDDNAYFFDIQGLNEATGHMLSVGASAPAVAATLKCRIGGTEYFIMLSAAEAT